MVPSALHFCNPAAATALQEVCSLLHCMCLGPCLQCIFWRTWMPLLVLLLQKVFLCPNLLVFALDVLGPLTTSIPRDFVLGIPAKRNFLRTFCSDAKVLLHHQPVPSLVGGALVLC